MEDTYNSTIIEEDPLRIEVLKLTNKHNGIVRYAATRANLKDILKLNEQSISRVLRMLKTNHIVNTSHWIVESSTVKISEGGF